MIDLVNKFSICFVVWDWGDCIILLLECIILLQGVLLYDLVISLLVKNISINKDTPLLVKNISILRVSPNNRDIHISLDTPC